ncbi:MAG: 1-deoxy-D-xylulose-5-phosphate reductoisomerase [Desulfatiglans sp.]|jgi:1-deoxy-D-xylulose-5-phosphate reductoisomerase|nr:1-deoxy-D-xylulose-5-phosphate reductoisomerase [Thermodesulfobacteriota bacterium]MEE4351261.1 1-deoxy-D-xylulose-5-phosphate reductoisomerase [Desulfatiglans sp.]
MKNISILGSTGSIGVNALQVIADNPDKYRVVGLSAGTNIETLSKQIEIFRPSKVAVLDKSLASDLASLCASGHEPEILFGTDGCVDVAVLDEADTVISAMSGAAGLLPTYMAVMAEKHVALANKETMVMAGPLIMTEAKRHGVTVIPIDSEHSAILQSLKDHPREDLGRVILTASGGPFRELSLDEMREVTPAQALNHPNWEMGPKISVDSATLMNKGLEVIEARWLFDLNMDQIGIVVHPQSIIHSMVEYVDGSIIAQLGVPDMAIPISYALSFPRHFKNNLPPLELDKVGALTFEKPDMERFPCLALSLEAAEIGDSMPTVLNGANEIAVESFLVGGIKFLDISRLVERTMAAHRPFPITTLDAVLEADEWARERARQLLKEDFVV